MGPYAKMQKAMEIVSPDTPITLEDLYNIAMQGSNKKRGAKRSGEAKSKGVGLRRGPVRVQSEQTQAIARRRDASRRTIISERRHSTVVFPSVLPTSLFKPAFEPRRKSLDVLGNLGEENAFVPAASNHAANSHEFHGSDMSTLVGPNGDEATGYTEKENFVPMMVDDAASDAGILQTKSPVASAASAAFTDSPTTTMPARNFGTKELAMDMAVLSLDKN
ncbi:hypothetical protein MKZ38_010796 [Zalerion maritima]|uniref:Uncharacterized protein n=1 Tax=Zalerion maritima TaxID=339359 RepID=A0AAD5S059_9PEZI|nr:hypothetical protein MKZ38_010796 [Zalerion maritima]